MKVGVSKFNLCMQVVNYFLFSQKSNKIQVKILKSHKFKLLNTEKRKPQSLDLGRVAGLVKLH